MGLDHLSTNLRILCSYGRSTSDICRRIGLNRQQFNKYLNGQSRPSLSTLRRICDFFGVDEAEILSDAREFADLIRLRPPKLPGLKGSAESEVAKFYRHDTADLSLLERHEGYYHGHLSPDPAKRAILRSLTRVYRRDGQWFAKSITRHRGGDYLVPEMMKYCGTVAEAHGRLVIMEREQGIGRSFWSTILVTSDYPTPTFLPGLSMGIAPEGSHTISAMRTIWQFLGRSPDLRWALSQCGLFEPDDPSLAEYVRRSDVIQPEGGSGQYIEWQG